MAVDYGSFSWPGSVSSNPSVGTTGTTAPISATEIGGVDSAGDLIPVLVDSDGTVHVNVTSIAPITGTVTANQGTPGVGAWPVLAAQTGTWNINNVSGTVSLPTGASTAANQATEIASLSSIDTNTTSIDANTQDVALATGFPLMALPTRAIAIGAYDGSQMINVACDSSGLLNVNVSSSTLPSGSATAANQVTGNNSLASIDTKTPALGQALAAASTPVVLTAAQISTLTPLTSVTVTQATGTNLHTVVDSGSVTVSGTVAATQSGTWTVQPGNTPNTTAWLVNDAAFAAVGTATNAYSSVNVTTAAYTQLIASTTTATKEIEIFDSSGQSLFLATGAAASEVNQIYIFPGGNGRVKLAIAAGTRISIKAVSANATSGNIYLNLYG